MTTKRKTKLSNPEAIDKQINMSGAGEDAAVRALVSPEFPTMPDSQAVEIALALQQIIQGQNSILERVNQNDASMTEQLNKLRERMDKYDEAAEKWDADRMRFVEEINSKAESLRATGAAQDKIVAQGAQMFQQELAIARAGQVERRLKFEEELRTMPKEIVVSPGKLETVMQNGQQITKIFNEEIRIRHKVWILKPGVPTEVPHVVAEVMRQRRMQEMELAERQALLQKQTTSEEVAQGLRAIDQKYHSGLTEFPIS